MRMTLAMLAIMAVAFTTACTSSTRATTLQGTVSQSDHRTGSAQASSPRATNQFPAVPGKVAIYVQSFPTSAVADGKNLTLALVVVNDLGRSFTVSAACNGWLEAGLVTKLIDFTAVNGAVECAGQVVPPGVTHLARAVATTYQSCSQDPQARITSNSPHCLGSNRDVMPPLPTGTYALRIDTVGIPDAVTPGTHSITLTHS